MRKTTFRRLCGLAAAGSFVMLFGTAGCMDNMTLDGAEALHRLLSQGAAYAACAVCCAQRGGKGDPAGVRGI